MSNPTLSQYGDFQAAFEHFNLALFGGGLPDTMLTLARTRHASGYVIPDGFTMRGDDSGTKTPEIGLNPQRFADRTAEQVLAALICEMVKLSQHVDGNASADGYLNRFYYGRCEAVGVAPDGELLYTGGPAEAAAQELLAQGWAVRYVAPVVTAEAQQRKAQRKASKTKYTCPITGANAWAKPGMILYSVTGHEVGTPMVANYQGED